MIQLLDAMMVMIGFYIITRMMIFLSRDDIQMNKSGKAVAQLLATATIGIAFMCIILAILSFFEIFDINSDLPY